MYIKALSATVPDVSLKVNTTLHESRIQSSIEDLADVILEVENEKVGREFKKYIIVEKVRNRPSMVGIIPCVYDKSGIKPA